MSFTGLDQPESWSFPSARGPRPVPVSTRLAVNTAEAALDAAIAGAGLTRVLSYQAASALAAHRLERVLKDHEPPPVPVSLLHHGQTPLPRKLRAFLDYATPRLRAVVG